MNFGPKCVTDKLLVNLDAADSGSYPGSGATWYDTSGYGYNGTLVASPTFNSSNNGSFYFDGSTQYVSFSSFPTFGSGEFSMEFFFKYASYTVGGCGPGSLFNMSYTAGGTKHIGLWMEYGTFAFTMLYLNGFATYGSTPNLTGNWAHAVATRSGPYLELYVNGVYSSATSTPSTATLLASGDFVLANTLCSANYFNGNLSLFRCYSKKLSPSEILQNYNANKNRYGLL